MTGPFRLFLILSFAGLRLAAADAPLRVLIESSSPPFSTLNAQGQPQGFAVDLLKAVAADQKFKVEFDLRPWEQVYADFQQGRGDILGLVASSEERAQHMDFSLPFEKLLCSVYYHSNHRPIHRVEDLRGLRLAVIKNAITQEFASRQPWGVVIHPYNSLAECLRAIERGEVDACLGTELVTDYLIRTLNFQNVERSELKFPDVSYNLCYAVQPGNKLLLAKINQGLLNLRLNREHEVLHERWLGPLEGQRLRWRDLEPYLLPVVALLFVVLGIVVWQRRLLVRLSEQARAIRENEERLQLVFEGSQDAFWDWDVASGHIMRSPRWASMLGYTLEEIGRERNSFVDLIHPEDLPLVLADEKRMDEGTDFYAHEFRMRAKTGEWKWILDRGKVVARDPATGRPRRIAGTHTDVTARKQAEEAADKLERKMRETQKLESLGVLAGGIAHDFNNLLSVVLGNASLARLESAGNPANGARLESIMTAANRAAELCRQLLAYAGKGSYSIGPLNLNDLIKETTRLLELSISKQARLEFAHAPKLPTVDGDASQIRQIIMNLVINASEAMADQPAGSIRLATSVVGWPVAGALLPTPDAELPPGEYVCMEVSDSGCGMTPEVLGRIFDPFFSTKFTGRGLGLAAVVGIVRSHKGALKVESTPGLGSVFRIYLPVSPTKNDPETTGGLPTVI
jgi:PAS domain S-box-containing protein